MRDSSTESLRFLGLSNVVIQPYTLPTDNENYNSPVIVIYESEEDYAAGNCTLDA